MMGWDYVSELQSSPGWYVNIESHGGGGDDDDGQG
jgi:hypothetical protein